MQLTNIHGLSTTSTHSSPNTTARSTKENKEFSSVLEQSTAKNPLSEHATTNINPLVHSALLNAVELLSVVDIPTSPEDAMENLLQLVEQYQVKLASTVENPSVTELHNELQKAEQEAEHIRNTYSLNEENPLNSILVSLEILLLRERHRINRGEYTVSI